MESSKINLELALPLSLTYKRGLYRNQESHILQTSLVPFEINLAGDKKPRRAINPDQHFLSWRQKDEQFLLGT